MPTETLLAAARRSRTPTDPGHQRPYATEDEMREAMPRGLSMYEEGNRTSRISFADTNAR